MNKEVASASILGFRKDNLNTCNMFQDVIERLYKSNFLSDSDIKRIYMQRMSALQYRLKLYTKDESSSVLYETAENMMKNIDYTLSVYLNSLPDIDTIGKELKVKEINYMTDKGFELIKSYMENGVVLLSKITETKADIDNIAYQDTIDYGLPLFFKKYEPYFKAMETDADIDYPVKDKKVQYEGCGIIYVVRYMKYLYLENMFLKHFDMKAVNMLLKSYDIRYKELLINMFTIVLTNCVGLVICGLDPQYLNLSEKNIIYIHQKLNSLSKDELSKTIYSSIKKCILILKINDNELIKYILQSSDEITDSVYNALSINHLNSIFNPLKEDKFIFYKDQEHLSDDNFRKIADEIYNCSKVKDKIEIMSESIKSLYDTIDILESDCFMEDEFEEYYKSIDFINIALLYKHMDEYDLDNDKECYKYLNDFIYKNDLKPKIVQIKDKIIFE